MHPSSPRPAGIGHAVGAAVLLGVSTPLAKRLLRDLSPWMLAGSLYLGAGAGLVIVWWLSPTSREPEAVAP